MTLTFRFYPLVRSLLLMFLVYTFSNTKGHLFVTFSDISHDKPGAGNIRSGKAMRRTGA